MKNKAVHRFVIGTFISLYLLVSVISTIHVIDFFKLSNPTWLAVSLAVAFELGAAASLASLVILDKMNRTLVWLLFATITLMQMQGNMYYAFVNMRDFQGWSELFGLIEEDVIYQKRVLAAVSGAILPLVALGFIKSLVDYIKPESQSSVMEEIKVNQNDENNFPSPIKESQDSKESNEILTSVLEEESKTEETQEEEERDEDHDLDLVLNEMVEDLEVPSEDPSNDTSDAVKEYYGDILIDGNGQKEVEIQESPILPVNSNRKGTFIDSSSKVSINPMRL